MVAASVINEVSATYHTTPDTVRLNTSSPTDLKVGADEPDQKCSALESEPNRVCSTTEPTVLQVPGKKSIPPTTDVVGQTKQDFSDGASIDSFGPEKPGSPMYEVTKSNKEVTAQKLPSTVSKGGNQLQEPLVTETRVPIANEDERVKADTNGTSSGELDNTPVESSPQLSKLNVVFDKRKLKSLHCPSISSILWYLCSGQNPVHRKSCRQKLLVTTLIVDGHLNILYEILI